MFGRKFVYDYAIFLIIGSQRNALSLAKGISISAADYHKPDRIFFQIVYVCTCHQIRLHQFGRGVRKAICRDVYHTTNHSSQMYKIE